jgi:hypothetical protein
VSVILKKFNSITIFISVSQNKMRICHLGKLEAIYDASTYVSIEPHIFSTKPMCACREYPTNEFGSSRSQ